MNQWYFTLGSKKLLDHPFLAPLTEQMCVTDHAPSPLYRVQLRDNDGLLSLHSLTDPKATPVSSKDLVHAWYLRSKSYRGKQEPISKALGLAKKASTRTVLDTTAGIGRDSIIIAQLSYDVIMIERQPHLACLLQQALELAAQEPWFSPIASQLTLKVGDAVQITMDPTLATTNIHAFYCDPMFQHKANKSANNKRLVQMLQNICHNEAPLTLDQHLLTELKPNQRLVIKRAPHEAALAGFLNYQIKGTTFRFDIHYRAPNA